MTLEFCHHIFPLYDEICFCHHVRITIICGILDETCPVIHQCAQDFSYFWDQRFDPISRQKRICNHWDVTYYFNKSGWSWCCAWWHQWRYSLGFHKVQQQSFKAIFQHLLHRKWITSPSYLYWILVMWSFFYQVYYCKNQANSLRCYWSLQHFFRLKQMSCSSLCHSYLEILVTWWKKCQKFGKYW